MLADLVFFFEACTAVSEEDWGLIFNMIDVFSEDCMTVLFHIMKTIWLFDFEFFSKWFLSNSWVIQTCWAYINSCTAYPVLKLNSHIKYSSFSLIHLLNLVCYLWYWVNRLLYIKSFISFIIWRDILIWVKFVFNKYVLYNLLMCLLKTLKALNCFISESSVAAHHICTIVNLTSFMWDLSSDDLSYINSEKVDFLSSLKINALWEFFVWERFVNTSSWNFFWACTRAV